MNPADALNVQLSTIRNMMDHLKAQEADLMAELKKIEDAEAVYNEVMTITVTPIANANPDNPQPGLPEVKAMKLTEHPIRRTTTTPSVSEVAQILREQAALAAGIGGRGSKAALTRRINRVLNRYSTTELRAAFDVARDDDDASRSYKGHGLAAASYARAEVMDRLGI